MAYAKNHHDSLPADTTSGSRKVMLALLAGAAAGTVAGLLLAPDKGSSTRASWRSTAGRYAEDLENTFNKYVGKIEDLAASGTGSELRLRGDWNLLKGQLREQYANLTDEDLTYAEGQADQLVGNLQRRLGKTKREIVQLLNNLG